MFKSKIRKSILLKIIAKPLQISLKIGNWVEMQSSDFEHL